MRRFLDAHETPKVGLWGCLLTCPMRVSSWASYVLRVGCIAHDVMRGVIVCPHLLVEKALRRISCVFQARRWIYVLHTAVALQSGWRCKYIILFLPLGVTMFPAACGLAVTTAVVCK